jgi:hypothetical protein
MSHTNGAGELSLGEFTGKAVNFALDADPTQVAVLKEGHSGRVIAAVFQAVQALNQNGERLFMPDIANDAAHRLASMLEDVAIWWKLYSRKVLPDGVSF